MSLQHILSTSNLSFLIPLVFYTSFFLTAGALALFIEAAIVLRTLVRGRVRAGRYPLLGLPLGASILCYIVAMAGWQAYYDWQNSMSDAHISLYVWNDILVRFNFLSISIIGLLQSALAIVLFILTLFLEKKLLPRINQRPLWTVVRRQRIV
jgi:hypothetical protein